LVAWNILVFWRRLGKNDLQAGELAADLHAVETLFDWLVFVINDNCGDLVHLMKALYAVFYNFRDRDRLRDGLSE